MIPSVTLPGGKKVPQLGLGTWRMGESAALNDDCIYLDNAGGSQVLRCVADRIRDYLLTTSVQLGASYAKSLEASQKVLVARRSVALPRAPRKPSRPTTSRRSC